MRYRNTIWHPPKLPHWNRSLFAELAALHTQPDSVPGAFGHRGRPAEEREHMSPISGPLKGVFSWTKMAGRTAFAIHKCFFPATVFLSAEQTEHAGITQMMRMLLQYTKHAVQSFFLYGRVLGSSLLFHLHSPSTSTTVCETDLSWRDRTNWSKDNLISLSSDSFRSRSVNQIWPGSLQEASRKVLLCS